MDLAPTVAHLRVVVNPSNAFARRRYCASLGGFGEQVDIEHRRTLSPQRLHRSDIVLVDETRAIAHVHDRFAIGDVRQTESVPDLVGDRDRPSALSLEAFVDDDATACGFVDSKEHGRSILELDHQLLTAWIGTKAGPEGLVPHGGSFADRLQLAWLKVSLDGQADRLAGVEDHDLRRPFRSACRRECGAYEYENRTRSPRHDQRGYTQEMLAPMHDAEALVRVAIMYTLLKSASISASLTR